jgi:hypothetical protein
MRGATGREANRRTNGTLLDAEKDLGVEEARRGHRLRLVSGG